MPDDKDNRGFTDTPANEPLVACQVCRKEIPHSVAVNEEGDSYVYHFCGGECHARWMEDEGRSGQKS